MPVIEKWEAYMLPNHSCFHSCFGAIPEEHFLEGTRLLSSPEKINSNYLRREFRRDCRRFVEDLVSNILSKVAARSQVGQGLSCFCPEIVIGAMTIPLSISLGNCWMGCLNLTGSEDQRSSLQRPNSTLLCVSSDRWKQAAAGLVLRSTACLPSAIRPVSVLGGICTKLVLLFFKQSRCCHNLTHMPF